MDKIIRLAHLIVNKPNIIKYLCLLAILLAVTSCKKNDEEFVIGSQFLESESSIIRVDTFSVELSSVIVDSFQTSGYAIAMVGQSNDDIFGKVTASSYFQLGIPESNGVDEDDIYDSVKFILTHTGYSYGDTTENLTIKLFPLASNTKFEDYEGTARYNTTTFAIDTNTLLGSITYKPFPYTDTTILVPMDSSIGLHLFNMLLDESDTVASDANFIDYFLRGVAMVPGEGAKSVINFHATSTQLLIRVYYHRYGASDKVDLQTDFPLINSSYQFNSVSHDFTGSDAELIKTQRQAILSTETNNSTFLMGGIGLVTCVRFPTLPDMLLIPSSFIIKAELVLRPRKNTYFEYPLPSDLVIYGTDKYNNLNWDNLFYNYDGSLVTASFIDDPYNESTSYTYDISSFIKSEFADSYFDVDHGLLIGSVPENFVNSFERMVIEASDPKPVLKLYYVKY